MAYNKLLLHLFLILFTLSFTSACKKQQRTVTTKVTPQKRPRRIPQKKNDHTYDFNNCRGGRPCTPEERERIELLQSWLDELYLRHETPVDKNYYTFSPTETHRPSIYFLGEEHGNVDVVFDNFSLIEQRYRSGDIVLFEGSKSGHPIPYCLAFILTEIYTADTHTRSREEYDVNRYEKLFTQQGKLVKDVYPVLQTQNIHLKDAKCEFWDVDHKELKNKKHSENEELRVRNKSLVTTVQNYKSSYNNLFIIAGNAHTPTGEYAWKKKYYPSEQQLQDFYNRSEGNNEVTTKEIYDAFHNSSIRYFNHQSITLY